MINTIQDRSFKIKTGLVKIADSSVEIQRKLSRENRMKGVKKGFNILP